MRARQYVDRLGEIHPAVAFSNDAEALRVADALDLAGFGAGFQTDAGLGALVAELALQIRIAVDDQELEEGGNDGTRG